MMTVVGSSCMARVTEEQGGDSRFIGFVVHLPLPGIVRGRSRTCKMMPCWWSGQPLRYSDLYELIDESSRPC